MSVFVVTHEPYHDNSTILGVFSSIEPAEAVIIQAAQDYLVEAEGKPADCELWMVEEWETDRTKVYYTDYKLCRPDYYEKYGKNYGGEVVPGLPFILVKSRRTA